MHQFSVQRVTAPPVSPLSLLSQRRASKKNRQWHLSSIFSIPQALGSEDFPSHRTWDMGFSDLTRVGWSDMALVGKATPMFSFRKQMYSYDQCMLGITLGHRVILKRSQHIDQKNGLQKLTVMPYLFERNFIRHTCCKFWRFTKRTTGLI